MALQTKLEMAQECIISEDANKCIAFFPCAHLLLCESMTVLVCPNYDGEIKELRRMYGQ